MEVHRSTEIYLKLGEDPRPEQWIPGGNCDAVGSSLLRSLLAGKERSPCQSRFAARNHGPVGDPHCSSLFLKDCTSCKVTTPEQFIKVIVIFTSRERTLEMFKDGHMDI
ncbi:hypothetical protein BTVI_132891 [Pitangus sulphuratus]|nr:hypothetical protein BTVI_132891 [Pitangus sulphuratus]